MLRNGPQRRLRSFSERERLAITAQRETIRVVLYPDVEKERETWKKTEFSNGRTSRRMMLRALGTFCALSMAAHMGAIEISSNTTDVIRSARKKLDDADALIDAARWDRIRTLLVSADVRDAHDRIRRTAASSPSEVRGAWVGLREEALSAAKLLDAAVYSNVFIGEDRKILGTPIDYDTPRIYLQQLKDAFDELIVLSGPN